MPVYIDSFNAKFGRMKMCHMIADTTKELLEMADKIGINRKWIQDAGTTREHFDVCLSKKSKAIENGAIQITLRELADKLCLKNCAAGNHTFGYRLFCLYCNSPKQS